MNYLSIYLSVSFDLQNFRRLKQCFLVGLFLLKIALEMAPTFLIVDTLPDYLEEVFTILTLLIFVSLLSLPLHLLVLQFFENGRLVVLANFVLKDYKGIIWELVHERRRDEGLCILNEPRVELLLLFVTLIDLSQDILVLVHPQHGLTP